LDSRESGIKEIPHPHYIKKHPDCECVSDSRTTRQRQAASLRSREHGLTQKAQISMTKNLWFNWISGVISPLALSTLTKMDEDGRNWTIFFVNIRLIVYFRLAIVLDGWTEASTT
jgi:hypothetical protein